MDPVAARHPRRILLLIASIGLVASAAACTPNEGPSMPTVAPTLAAVPGVPSAARVDRGHTKT